ncbi:MAG: hypothetical protein HY889_10505 [Deltaproteobacteria bacterium]|nr:hypothetical protein [Deltaproteobacteria bacterium]
MYLNSGKIAATALTALSLCLPAAAAAEVVVKPAVTAGIRYDSNATISAANEQKKDDFIVTLSPQFDIINDRQKIVFDFMYRVTGLYYLKDPQLNTINHFVTADMKAEYSQTTKFDISDSFSYLRQSLLASQTNIQTSRYNIMANTATLRMEHEFTPKTSMTANISDNVLKYEDPAAYDTRTDSAGVAEVYKITPATSTDAGYTFTNYSFEPSGSTKGIQTHTLRLGLTEQFSPTLTFNIFGSAVYQSGAGNSRDWESGASVTKAFMRSTLSGGYARTVATTSGLTNTLGINQTYSLSYDYRTSERSDAMIYGAYSKNRTSPASVDLESYNAGLRWAYQIREWLAIGAGYDHFDQRSRGSVGTDVRRDQVYVSATVTPYEWRF